MITISTFYNLRKERFKLREPVGLVPTMGYLHEGHLSLVRLARQECRSVVTSIFVNPTQFGPGEDLNAYPRDLPRDLAMLEEEGVDLVWAPTQEIVYPADYQTWVNVEEVTRFLEGSARPGHFRGVATVVAKLFNAVQPQKAYFGQKDAQQVIVIRRMVEDLNFPVDIVVGPIIREQDGLAMSSRNVYLSAEERRAATVLFRTLCTAQKTYRQGERNAERLRRLMMEMLAEEPLARPQYVSCADRSSLGELDQIAESGALLSLAVFFGRTRLIDNLILE